MIKLFSDATHHPVLDNLILSHPYEPPRGRSGIPLAVASFWFPIIGPTVEQLSLTQVVYRTLSSVREPFRKTRLVLESVAAVQEIYTELLDWGLSWARSSFGASMMPISLSLEALAAREEKLWAITTREIDACEACARLIAWGAGLPATEARRLASMVSAGNAWLFVEDDCDERSMEAVQQAFDHTFHEAGPLSHAAIIFVTADPDHRLLSDCQDFHSCRPVPLPALRRKTDLRTAAFCRLAARLGSPSARQVNMGILLILMGVLFLVARQYEPAFAALQSSGGSPGRFPAIFWVILFHILVPTYFGLFAASRWGLDDGSEEIRVVSVGAMITGGFGFLAWWLPLLAQGMGPGIWKTVVVLVLSLPGAVLLSIALVTTFGLAAEVGFHLLSIRLARTGLASLVDHFQVELHLAVQGPALKLPSPGRDHPPLPLLVSFRTAGLLSEALARYPKMHPKFTHMLFDGLKKRMSVASLALKGLRDAPGKYAERLRKQVSRRVVRCWPDREAFAEGALEMTARELCYLTDMEELVVVR